MDISDFQVDNDIENEGFQSAKDGKPMEDCPYDIGSIERALWITVWGDYYYQ